LPYLAESLIHNRQKVGFRFGGCPNVDRLVRSVPFQEFAALLIENNCSLGYFGMPRDVGFMAIVRACWLHRNPGTNFLDADQYSRFTESAKRYLVAGAKRTWTTMRPNSEAWLISHAVENVSFGLDCGFKALAGKLNQYL